MSSNNNKTSYSPFDNVLFSTDPEDEKLLIIRAYSVVGESEFDEEELPEDHELYLVVGIDEDFQTDVIERYQGFLKEANETSLKRMSYLDGARYRPVFKYCFHNDEEFSSSIAYMTSMHGFIVMDAADFGLEEHSIEPASLTEMVFTDKGLSFSSIHEADLTILVTIPLKSECLPIEVQRQQDSLNQFKEDMRRLTEQQSRLEQQSEQILGKKQKRANRSIATFEELKDFVYNRFDVPRNSRTPNALKELLGADFLDLDLRQRENWEFLRNLYQVEVDSLTQEQGIKNTFKSLRSRLKLEGLEKLEVDVISTAQGNHKEMKLSVNGKHYPYLEGRQFLSQKVNEITLRAVVSVLNDQLKSVESKVRASAVSDDYILLYDQHIGTAIRLHNGIRIARF